MVQETITNKAFKNASRDGKGSKKSTQNWVEGEGGEALIGEVKKTFFMSI